MQKARIKLTSSDFNLLNKTLDSKYGGNWVILVRMHPNSEDMSRLLPYNDHLINATYYDDMYELLSVADVLITDYSSTMFEFSFSQKPVFLYAPDVIPYREDRDFYFDLLSLPYSVSETNVELMNNILAHNETDYENKLYLFNLKLGLFENGDAAKQVGEFILHNIMDQDS